MQLPNIGDDGAIDLTTPPADPMAQTMAQMAPPGQTPPSIQNGPAVTPPAGNPAGTNLWLQFLQNLGKGGFGGGAGNAQQPTNGHNMSSQGSPPNNPVMQQAASGAAKSAMSGCCG